MKPDLRKDNSIPLPTPHAPTHTAAGWLRFEIFDSDQSDVAAVHLDDERDFEATTKAGTSSLGAETGASSLQRKHRQRSNRKINPPETDL